jgi:hypothetical protein
MLQGGLGLGMSRQLLDFRDRGTGADQRRDVESAERMEVGHAVFRLVGDPARLEVGSDRLACVVMEREHRLAGALVLQPVAQRTDDRQRDGLLDGLAVLCPLGDQGDERSAPIKME